jgi:hypothetical protein
MEDPAAETLEQASTAGTPVLLDEVKSCFCYMAHPEKLALVRVGAFRVIIPPPLHDGRSFVLAGKPTAIRFVKQEDVGEEV